MLELDTCNGLREVANLLSDSMLRLKECTAVVFSVSQVEVAADVFAVVIFEEVALVFLVFSIDELVSVFQRAT